MVMIDRTFNQEERSNLTQDKRMVLVDPGKKKKSEAIWSNSFSYRKVLFNFFSLPCLFYRQLLGRLLLWDEIQTFPRAPPL